MKEYFEKKFGQGTAFDLDYGKLLIVALLVYIAFFKYEEKLKAFNHEKTFRDLGSEFNI